MKRILLVLACLAALVSVPAKAQISLPSTLWHYTWPAATSTGQVGQYIVLASPLQSGGPTLSYTVDAYVTGTLPTTCTFEVQSSPDGVVWNTGAASLSGDTSCASASAVTVSFAFKPVAYIRINVMALSGGDGTTQVHFFYTRAIDGK
jgi:hypothetical protein